MSEMTYLDMIFLPEIEFMILKVFKSMSLIVREPDIVAPQSANLMFNCQYRNQNNEDYHLTMK